MAFLEKKGVGVNPLGHTHYIDHLAVICYIMNIPLLFIDEGDYALGKKYYPNIDAQFVDYHTFNPEYLIVNYDVLFMSDLWDRESFRAKYAPLEQKYHKRLRNVHCPHGFSDKGFYLQKCAYEDITLIYGQNMLDQLRLYDSFQHLNSYVITGNYRYTFFKQQHSFYERVIQEEVLSQFSASRPIILYAPTWMDSEESSTFFDVETYLFEQLPANYNMIVKLHPHLERDDPARYYQILGKYENKGNIVFLSDFPLVYPILAHTDIYIGDMSSVGYDFLAFNKPLFFLNRNNRDSKVDRGVLLFQCGVEIFPEQFSNIYQIIAQSLPEDATRFSEIREAMYAYTFGPEKAFETIKSEIIQAYSSE